MLKTVWKLYYHSKCLPGLAPEGIFLTTAHSWIILFPGSPPQATAGLALPLEQPHEDVGEVKGNQRSLQSCSWGFCEMESLKSCRPQAAQRGFGKEGVVGKAALGGCSCAGFDGLWWSLLFSQSHSSSPTQQLEIPLLPFTPCTLLPLLSPAPHPPLKAAQNGSARALGKPWRSRMGMRIRTAAESPQGWHRRHVSPHISTAAAFWPEEGILQWNICFIPKQWQDAASSILPAPYPQPWSHIWVPDLPQLHISFCAPSPLLSCLFIPVYSKSLFSLPFNPLLHPDPNTHLWDVSFLPSPGSGAKPDWPCCVPWQCSQVKQLPGNPCSSCSAPRQGMLTLVWGPAFGEFTCQTQVVSPQVSHNVPAKYQGLTRVSSDFLRSCMNVFLPVSKYKAWGWHPAEELQPKQVWQCWDLKLWSYNGKCLAFAASGAAASATTVPSVRQKLCLATGLFGFNFPVSLTKPRGLWVLNKARIRHNLFKI